jgi:hypothetical protein
MRWKKTKFALFFSTFSQHPEGLRLIVAVKHLASLEAVPTTHCRHARLAYKDCACSSGWTVGATMDSDGEQFLQDLTATLVLTKNCFQTSTKSTQLQLINLLRDKRGCSHTQHPERDVFSELTTASLCSHQNIRTITMTKLDVYLEAGRVYWLGHTCFNFFLIAL